MVIHSCCKYGIRLKKHYVAHLPYLLQRIVYGVLREQKINLIIKQINKMEYKGKLYGRVGKNYFPLIETTEDIEALKQQIKDLKKQCAINDVVLQSEQLFCENCDNTGKTEIVGGEVIICEWCKGQNN